MGVQIAHFPSAKTFEEFEFKFQPSIDQRLVRELATKRFISAVENVLVFGPPGEGEPWELLCDRQNRQTRDPQSEAAPDEPPSCGLDPRISE